MLVRWVIGRLVAWNLNGVWWVCRICGVSAADINLEAAAEIDARTEAAQAMEAATSAIFRGSAIDEDAMLAVLDAVAPWVNEGRCKLVLSGLRFGLLGPPDEMREAVDALERGPGFLPPDYQHRPWVGDA